jgi:hypothetical protein
MQYRKGPNAVRRGHTATFASLDLRKAGAKTQDLGPSSKAEQRLSRCMALTQKTANQRLSYCRWCWLLLKCQNAAFWHSESPQTHNTRTASNALPAPHRPVLPPGSSLASCGKSPAARRNQDEPTTPPKRRQRQERHLGRSDAAGGHFNGTRRPDPKLGLNRPTAQPPIALT